MARTVLPWESVPAPIYMACDAKPRKKWVQAGGWILVVVLFAAGFLTRWKVSLLFSVLYALALMMQKYVAVTQRGLEIYHQMQISTNYECWHWEDMFSVTHDPDAKNPGQTTLYFTKGDRTKRANFSDADAREVLRMAKEKNSAIRIYDGQETKKKAEASRKGGKK